MAALLEPQIPELRDLRQVRVEQLGPLLAEEVRIWRQRMAWDVRPSTDLVRRFVHEQSLSGYALVVGETAVGYSYYVCEEHKGLIGDLFLVEEFRTVENENRLLEAVVETLAGVPRLRRIESQLLTLLNPRHRTMPGGGQVRVHERNFMMVDLARARELRPRSARKALLEPWSERCQDEAARVIAAAYRGHVDSQINDQYQSLAGARRFLFNIVQYPGCGSFFQPASWAAVDRETNRLCGLSLASLVAADVGHITQICVLPEFHGIGLGYELLRHSLTSLAEAGCGKASLTVTASNEDAVRLYERVGFVTLRRFPAMVWEF